jgi:excisionase family DNA binding protein
VRNISVREAAEALGVTTRTIQYKLQNGDLKGTRARNQYGKDEWRIYPNKQIADAIAQKTGNASAENNDFSPALEGSIVDAEDMNGEEFSEPTDWRHVEQERLEIMAEKLIKPLAEKIEAQGMALQEQQEIIARQRRELLLLPDLEKRAEEERKAAELRALEVEALKKQIEAIGEEKQRIQEGKLQAEEAANEAQSKLQNTEALKVEIQEQLQAVKGNLSTLTEKLEKLEQPWWKKWFGE